VDDARTHIGRRLADDADRPHLVHQQLPDFLRDRRAFFLRLIDPRRAAFQSRSSGSVGLMPGRSPGSAAAHTLPIILPENTTLCFNRSKQGGTMRVRRLDHVLLAMPAGRETDARNFYAGILGIPEAKKPAELASRGGCWFEDG